jgi:hypothetical protein
MSPADLEKMFTDLRSAHSGWTPRLCSGFVHGVRDEADRKDPQRCYVRDAKLLDHYALGYLIGFSVTRGIDAAFEPWFGLVELLVEEAK